MSTIKFRSFHFKDGNPYAGGPCILEDGTVAWAALSDEEKEGQKVTKLVLFPIEVDDQRPRPTRSFG